MRFSEKYVVQLRVALKAQIVSSLTHKQQHLGIAR